MQNQPTFSATFAALPDATCFAIVERLITEGELRAGDLAAATDLSAPAVSRHLKALRNAGIVAQRVDGQRRLYSARPEPLRAISAWTGTHDAFWEASLDRLDRVLSQGGTVDGAHPAGISKTVSASGVVDDGGANPIAG